MSLSISELSKWQHKGVNRNPWTSTPPQSLFWLLFLWGPSSSGFLFPNPGSGMVPPGATHSAGGAHGQKA